MKTVTVKLEDFLHKRLKFQLVFDEKSFQDYMVELIECDLENRKESRNQVI
ncbi:hypothetical protein [uncultured Clostridium sp.]|uniref:hypothetical protein n=1 Tax=uncultured Clostridium sp. TaxID=59620 RepID=UPI00261FEB62|nr:hypothetical protein [uncultured Clostridium sp.]